MSEEGFLHKAYSHGSGDEARRFYDDWAATYDAEIAENGYVTPMRCAAALAGLTPERAAPVLDIGCGTGLGGAALRDAGFLTVDGWDPSPEMLARAEATGLYRAVAVIDPEAPFAAPDGAYAAAFASGVFSPGLAPPEGFEQVLGFLPAGGVFVFSLNDHAVEDGAYLARIEKLVEDGVAALAFREYGDHLPGSGLRSWVYALTRR